MGQWQQRWCRFLQRPGPLGGSGAVSETVADWIG